MTVRPAAPGFLAICRCTWRAWFTNRADAQAADAEHGWGCRWSR
jgi:hypothetical protein